MFCLRASVCTVGVPGAQSPERVLELLELEFQAVVSCLMWMLGTKCRAFAAQLVLVLNLWAISLALFKVFNSCKYLFL